MKPQLLKEELSAIKAPVMVRGRSIARSKITDRSAGQAKLREKCKLDKIERRMLPNWPS
jgi:hypothetical protein